MYTRENPPDILGNEGRVLERMLMFVSCEMCHCCCRGWRHLPLGVEYRLLGEVYRVWWRACSVRVELLHKHFEQNAAMLVAKRQIVLSSLGSAPTQDT